MIDVSVVKDVPSNRLKLTSDAVTVRSFVSESELSCACATCPTANMTSGVDSVVTDVSR